MGFGLMYACLFISLYFEVFMLMAFIETQRSRAARMPVLSAVAPELPTVAIIVPCFNEEKTLAHTIESLQALEYPVEKLEIIIVDDGSKDKTLEVARHYATEGGGVHENATVRTQQSLEPSKDPKTSATPVMEQNSRESRILMHHTPLVKVFHKENGGKHSAMNYALAHTQAALIGCLDADSTVAPDALSHIAPIFGDPRIAAVIQAIHVKKPENSLQYLQEVEYRLSLFNRFTLAALGSTFITPGPFSIFRRAVVREMGGWRHGHSTEDREMALRIQLAGHLIANAPRAQVITSTPRTVRALIRQRVRWTYGFLRNAMDYRHMFANKKFGNLGLIILPSALVSIGIALFFFFRVLYYTLQSIMHLILRTEILGISYHPSFDIFYFNTSILWFVIWASVALVLIAISIGSRIGTGRQRLPKGTPLFVLFYGFLAPIWLGLAVVRAVFKTGVKWR